MGCLGPCLRRAWNYYCRIVGPSERGEQFRTVYLELGSVLSISFLEQKTKPNNQIDQTDQTDQILATCREVVSDDGSFPETQNVRVFLPHLVQG